MPTLPNGRQAPKKKPAKKKPAKQPAQTPLKDLGPGPRARRMMEKKSRDASPPEDLQPFPDFVIPGRFERRARPLEPYRGLPQGRSATDTPSTPDRMEPVPRPAPKAKKQFVKSKVMRLPKLTAKRKWA
jgi:hypothetical protein